MITKIYLSHFLANQTPLYGGASDLEIVQTRNMTQGDTSNNSYLKMPNHAGTHLDYPRHFSSEGKHSDDYNADFWFFENPFVLAYQAQENEIITLKKEINIIPQNTDFLILNSGFQKYRGTRKFWNNNPGMSPESADLLRQRCPNLRIIGFDFISLTSYQNRPLGRVSHKKYLIENDILIIEDMDLSQLPDQIQKLYCFPLLIRKTDGAPITIIAEY